MPFAKIVYLLLTHALHVQGMQFLKRDKKRDKTILVPLSLVDTDLTPFDIRIFQTDGGFVRYGVEYV